MTRTTSAIPRYLSKPRRPVRPTRSRHKITLKALKARGEAPNKRTKEGKARAARIAWLEDTREKFQAWTEADTDQKQRELDDLAFYAGEQWPEDVLAARAGQAAQNGVPPIPARPCLVINKMREPVNQVLDGLRDAEIGIELTPADDFAALGIVLDRTEIQTREGLLRRIQRDSQAANMRLWAAGRALIAGRGFYGVMTRFVEASIEGPAHISMWDQELYVTGWFNQACITLDPAHEQPDGSDAKGGFIGEWITFADYETTYPAHADRPNLLTDLDDDSFVALGEDAPTWFRGAGDLRAVHIVNYFYVVEEFRELCLLADDTAAWKDELPAGADVVDTRDVPRRTVKWCVLDGANPDPLVERDWLGPDIPIIKVVGEELQPYDDQRRVEGLVRPGKDSNQGFNAMASKAVELVALTPIPSVYLANGQDEGFKAEWDLATTRTMGRLHYNHKDAEGNVIGPPTTINRDAPIQPVAMALQMFDEAVQTTTRRHDPSLGKVDPALKSGRAISQVIDQSKEGTSNFGDNQRISARRECVILNNLLYPVYGRRPGRLARIIDGTREPQTVLLGVPYLTQDGRHVPYTIPHPDDPTRTLPMPMDHPSVPATAQKYLLTPNAKANINVTIKKNYDTRRQEQNELLVGLVEADPTQMLVVGDLLWDSSDLPAHEELAERYRLMLAPPIQAMLLAKQNGGPQIPPAIQAQLEQAKAMGAQATQEIQALTFKLQAKQVEQEGKIQITAMQELAETQRDDKDREAKLAVAVLNAKIETQAQLIAMFMEERQRIGAHVTDVNELAQQHAHDAAERSKERLHDMVHASLEHQHTIAELSHEAAVAPDPAPTAGEP